jgi:hypothetical protein
MLRIVGVLMALAIIHPALADSRSLTRSLEGSQLELRLSCVKTVTIDPEPGMEGKIEITASADSQDELDRLEFSGGTVARVTLKDNCRHFLGHPSLTLAIKVPPATPISLDDAGAGEYAVGSVGGTLKAELAGAGELRIQRITALDLRSAGAAEIRIDRLDGPGSLALAGAGEVTIGDGTMPKLKLESDGAGAFHVKGGEIGTLDISLAGAGDAEIHAPVQDASLEIAGIGNIHVDKVTGTVHRSSVSGFGNIEIGH